MYIREKTRPGLRRRLGASDPQSASLWAGITQNSLNPFVFLPEDWNYIFGTDPDFLANPSWDAFSNAGYGTLTQGQINQLRAEAAQSIAKASGGDTVRAKQQTEMANADMNSVVSTYGGVAPSAANLTLTPPLPFDIPWWLWAAGAGVGGLLVWRAVK